MVFKFKPNKLLLRAGAFVIVLLTLLVLSILYNEPKTRVEIMATEQEEHMDEAIYRSQYSKLEQRDRVPSPPIALPNDYLDNEMN